MNRKEYRRRKIEWFEKLNEKRDKELRQRKKEFELFKERARLEMELTRIRIVESHTRHSLDVLKAKEAREEECKQIEEEKEKEK